MTRPTKAPGQTETGAILEKFRGFEPHAAEPAWLASIRKAGAARFRESGFPTLDDEDWRFTNVAPLAKLPFRPAREGSSDGLTVEALEQFPLGKLAATRLVFVNGHFAPELSQIGPQPDGVKIGSLAEVLANDAALLEPYLARHVKSEDHSTFAALNAAFFQDGAFIHVPKGCTVDQPVHLVYVTTSGESGATTHPRNLIIARDASRLTVIESYVATVGSAYFTNAVSEMVVGDGAVVEHCKFQDESTAAFHLSTLGATLGRGSNFISHSIVTGARLSRSNLRAELAGEGLEAILNGLYITKGEQLADHHMIVDHAKPHCASHEYFNGILDDKSKGVFHGRILVRPDAQKTDAKQTNKNLLLSDTATIDTKPQLEIYADDVKCTHGATVGQLNEESIFYLRARGIGADTAKRMLIHAFAGEIIERIRCEPVREELDRLVWERLEQNPHVAAVKG
jgi:Fe-S cluster assembly protein SufD